MSDQDTSVHKASGAGSAAAGWLVPRCPGRGITRGGETLFCLLTSLLKKVLLLLLFLRHRSTKNYMQKLSFSQRVTALPSKDVVVLLMDVGPATRTACREGVVAIAHVPRLRGLDPTELSQALLGVASGLASAQGLCRFDTSS